MAEVVGSIASVTTLVEVALKLERLISRLHDAPEELLALSNEIADLRFLFADAEKVIRGSPDSEPRFSKPLDDAACRIKDIDSFLQTVDTVAVKVVDRMTRFRYKPKVCRLQSALRESRLHLAALLGLETLSVHFLIPKHTCHPSSSLVATDRPSEELKIWYKLCRSLYLHQRTRLGAHMMRPSRGRVFWDPLADKLNAQHPIHRLQHLIAP